MYRTFEIAVSSLVILFVLSCGCAIAGPKLICEEPSYNFGEKEEGELVEHTFIIKNVGDAPAEMKKPVSQCGCMTTNDIEVKGSTITPGTTTSITVKMSLTGQHGHVRRGITIPHGSSNQGPLRLIVEGAVTSTVAIVPENIGLGQVEADKEVIRTAIVSFALKEPVRIEKCVSETNTVVPTVETLKDGGVYRVTVRVRPPQGISNIQTQVTLHTDSEKHPIVNIPVVGTVVGDLLVTPDSIALAGSTTESATRYVVIESPRSRAFEIKEVQCPSSAINAEIKPMGQTKYRLEISGLTASPELEGKAVLVKTNVPSVPVIAIPLHIIRPTTNHTQPQAQASQLEEGAIRCKEKTADCGKVRIGQSVQYTFRLFNTSNATRHIVSVTPGCGCTKVIGFSKDIAPQSWGEVTVSPDTTGNPGIRQSSIRIVSDDLKQPQLIPKVLCDVLPAIEAKPATLHFASEKTTSGFVAQTTELIGLYPDEKLAIGNMQISDPMISVTTETVEAQKRFRLHITVDKEIPAGVTLAQIVIPIEGSAQKNIRLPITVVNESKIKAEPSILELPIAKDTYHSLEIVVRASDGRPLEVNKVQLANEKLAVVSSHIASDAVSIRLEKIKMTCNMNRKHIVVSTNHGDLRIPTTVRSSCTIRRDQPLKNAGVDPTPKL